MPHIQVSLYLGRDDELKSKMANELKNTIVKKNRNPKRSY